MRAFIKSQIVLLVHEVNNVIHLGLTHKHSRAFPVPQNTNHMIIATLSNSHVAKQLENRFLRIDRGLGVFDLENKSSILPVIREIPAIRPARSIIVLRETKLCECSQLPNSSFCISRGL